MKKDSKGDVDGIPPVKSLDLAGFLPSFYEVKNKVLHVESEDPELLELFLKIIEEERNVTGSKSES